VLPGVEGVSAWAESLLLGYCACLEAATKEGESKGEGRGRQREKGREREMERGRERGRGRQREREGERRRGLLGWESRVLTSPG